MRHPYFAGIAWEELYDRDTIYVPSPQSAEDTSYFEPPNLPLADGVDAATAEAEDIATMQAQLTDSLAAKRRAEEAAVAAAAALADVGASGGAGGGGYTLTSAGMVRVRPGMALAPPSGLPPMAAGGWSAGAGRAAGAGGRVGAGGGGGGGVAASADFSYMMDS
jgi:hypothetical protein